MDTRYLARLLVRLYAASFLLYAVNELSYLGRYVRAARTVHTVKDLDSAAASDLSVFIFRVALYLLVVLVLFVKTDRVIEVLGGRKSPAPMPAPENKIE